MPTSTARAPRNGEENRSVELTIPPKLYGRDREIEALSGAFAQAASGQGVVLLVAGRSGSGKTALVTALRKAVLNENGYFLEGKFNQYQQGIPLFAIRQTLRQLAGQLLSESLPERERWKARILEALGQLGGLLTDLVPELQPLIGPQPPVPEISPYEAPHRFASVLRNFLGSFCQPEHPVVLFLDDWQWADAASLAVLRHLQVNETLRYLLVIVSYRDDEVDSSHPLTGAIDELHGRSVPVRTLEVRHLTTADVEQLLADTLRPSDGDLGRLAKVIQGYTQGNPFFIRAVLDFLHANETLWFDRSRQLWRWDPARISEVVGTGDVVELFARKLRCLPPSCGDLLSLAACIGNRFEVETLALVSDRSVDDCQRLLRVALAEGMIQPLDGGSEDTSRVDARASGQFTFLHDRVQQAAHSLLAPADLPAVRLRIGRLLTSNLVRERLDERLLEVTDHLNAGRLLIQDDAQRLQLLQLNIAAGHKARTATAYRAALQFHRVAGEFLAVPAFAELFWEQHHDQALQLFKEWAETEFLEGDRAEAERCIREAVAHARTPIEQADALCVLIVQYTLMAKYPQSIDAGRRALAALGILLPESAFEAERDAEIEQVRRHLHNRTVASIEQLPLMTDPVILMATKVLITMGPPCYRSHPRLWSVIVPKVVELTIRYGHIPQAGYSYPAFGGLLGWVANDYAVAREFGASATRLMTEVFRSPSDQSVFYLMIGSSLRHWSEHLSAASQDYAQAWETGLRSGNLQYAAYAMGHNMYCRFYQGVPLAKLIQESQQSLVFSRTRTNEWAIDLLEGGLQVFGRLAIAAFSQDGAEPRSEEEYLRRVVAHHNIQVACIYRVLKTFSLLVLREYERALALSNEAEAIIETVGTQGLLPWPEHVFTRFLLLASLYPEASADRKVAWRSEMGRIVGQLKIWAGQCSANYSHKLSLASAEVARLDGRPLEALRLYETAIDEARAGRFIQWEAIACERAADLAETCGEGRLAQVYWENAYVCYRRWGAGEKLRLMEAEFRTGLSSKIGDGAPQSATAERARLQDALNARLKHYLDTLCTDASRLTDDDERHGRLIEELTQAAANLREEVAERKKVEEALRESEQRFSLVSKATNDAIWDWDLITDSLWWSDGFETSFGYRRHEVEQTIESWTTRIHPEDRDHTVSSVQRVINGEGVHWSGEYRYRCKDGKHADVLDRGYIIRDATGRAVRMIGSMTDLTERKTLEGRLLQSQKTEAIGRLAGGIAHDFNNLLTIITGYTEMLMSMVVEGDSKRPLLADIHNAGERAANLTQQLLAFSRKQLLAPRVLDVNTVVSNVEKMLRRLIGEDILLTAVLAPNLRRVKVDPGQLEQVIINLAVNARDAMPDGGRLTIETRNAEINETLCQAKPDLTPGSYVALTVSDTGCGMSPEVKARLFEPFFTTKQPGQGTGLGLATVFGIVKQSDGLIDVYSEVGVGTRFRILFPAVVEQKESSVPTEEPARKGNETVLLVEDAEPVRRIAKLALETYGYRVLEAANGREAIHRFESHASPIHLVITDVVMPEMSGRELVEHLRRHRAGTKVLFMSGYTDDAVVRHGVIQAADAFLQKPFTPMGLARKVREVIEERSTG